MEEPKPPTTVRITSEGEAIADLARKLINDGETDFDEIARQLGLPDGDKVRFLLALSAQTHMRRREDF